MRQLQHATNAELLLKLRRHFPAVSATTIHRATARLAERGELGIAPTDTRGSIRYDVQTKQHDHFVCQKCGDIKDIFIEPMTKSTLKTLLSKYAKMDSITICGVCNGCKKL